MPSLVNSVSVDDLRSRREIKNQNKMARHFFKNWTKRSKLVRFTGHIRHNSSGGRVPVKEFKGYSKVKRKMASLEVKKSTSKSELQILGEDLLRKSLELEQKTLKQNGFYTPKFPRINNGNLFQTPGNLFAVDVNVCNDNEKKRPVIERLTKASQNVQNSSDSSCFVTSPITTLPRAQLNHCTSNSRTTVERRFSEMFCNLVFFLGISNESGYGSMSRRGNHLHPKDLEDEEVFQNPSPRVRILTYLLIFISKFCMMVLK